MTKSGGTAARKKNWEPQRCHYPNNTLQIYGCKHYWGTDESSVLRQAPFVTHSPLTVYIPLHTIDRDAAKDIELMNVIMVINKLFPAIFRPTDYILRATSVWSGPAPLVN